MHSKIENIFTGTGGGGGSSEPAIESPRYVFEDGRWVAEHYDYATRTWQREDMSAADQREQALTRAYNNSELYGANAAPPPMAAAAPPPVGAASPTSGGRFTQGGSVHGRYVDMSASVYGR